MSNYYIVCWKDNIENLINDDVLFYDSPKQLSDTYTVNYILAETKEEAVRQYLLAAVDNAYHKKTNWLQIKRRCAARIVRRIVAEEMQLLPQQVISSGCYNKIATIVNECIKKAPVQLPKTNKKGFFNYLAKNIDISEVAAWIDIHSVFELYFEIFSKDVMAHELEVISKYAD